MCGRACRNLDDSLALEMPSDITLNSYPGAYGQVLTNLIFNAVTHGFTDGRGGHVLIKARRLGMEQVEITFSDDGSGIPEDVQRHVFDPFFTTRRAQGSTGLGLYIVHNRGAAARDPAAPSRQSRAPIMIAAPSPLIDRLYRRARPAINQAAPLRSIRRRRQRAALTPPSQRCPPRFPHSQSQAASFNPASMRSRHSPRMGATVPRDLTEASRFPNQRLSDSWAVGLEEGRPMRRYALRDDQWDRIKDFLPGREGHVGGTAADNRLFVEAVLFRYRAGVPWRDLPERFGDWKVVYQRFSRWAKSGVFERIFKLLANDHDNEYMMIDATIVRAHQHSAGARKKTARKRSADPAAD